MTMTKKYLEITALQEWHNKNIMVGILLAGKALLKSPYVKRYVFFKQRCI